MKKHLTVQNIALTVLSIIVVVLFIIIVSNNRKAGRDYNEYLNERLELKNDITTLENKINYYETEKLKRHSVIDNLTLEQLDSLESTVH